MRIGRFIWHDLMTPNVEAAKAFYTSLFGWTTRPMDLGSGDGYPVIHDGVEELGGFMHLDPREGFAPHWMPYVTVWDMTSASRQVEALGGTTCVPAFELPHLGRMTVIEDDQGALLTLIQEHRPWRDDAAAVRPGHFAWHTLTTRDLAKAIAFYSSLLGWTIEELDLGGTNRTVFRRAGQPVADIVPPSDGLLSANWMCAISVANLARAHARALALGATQIRSPPAAGASGQQAILRDPTGAPFALLQLHV